MTKKQRAAAIVARLEQLYAVDHGLEYAEAWQLVVAVRLAAQCTDARVNIVVKDLFKKYPSPAALAKAPVEDIERMVRSCGLGHSKARDISGAMNMLESKYGGRVPDTMDELLALPGVGRKSANLILGDIYGKPAIVTDTHCIRLTNRMGLTDSKNPAVVEKQLWALIEPEKGNDFCHRLVMHGRAVCTARSPKCGECGVRELCLYKDKTL